MTSGGISAEQSEFEEIDLEPCPGSDPLQVSTQIGTEGFLYTIQLRFRLESSPFRKPTFTGLHGRGVSVPAEELGDDSTVDGGYLFQVSASRVEDRSTRLPTGWFPIGRFITAGGL
jgi:hypothetical protein